MVEVDIDEMNAEEVYMDNSNVDLRLKLEMIEILQVLLLEDKLVAENRVSEIRDDVLKQVMASMGLNVSEEILIPEDIAKFRRMLSGETDRGCALACAAYLQSEITDLLKAYLFLDYRPTVQAA